jgi:tetratricopeptide (TPR) repeat protein
MPRRKKSKKSEQPTSGFFLLVLAGFIVVIFIGITVGRSLQDMQPDFREDHLLFGKDQTPTANTKQAVGGWWDAEDAIGSQIERALTYGQESNLAMQIKNIQDNLAYTRNKAAVLFYCAYAYEQTGRTEEALKIYRQLRNTYVNQHVSLYVFNAARAPADYRIYSVNLYEETALREYQITKEQVLLEYLRKSTALYGIPSHEAFRYALQPINQTTSEFFLAHAVPKEPVRDNIAP